MTTGIKLWRYWMKVEISIYKLRLWFKIKMTLSYHHTYISVENNFMVSPCYYKICDLMLFVKCLIKCIKRYQTNSIYVIKNRQLIKFKLLNYFKYIF